MQDRNTMTRNKFQVLENEMKNESSLILAEDSKAEHLDRVF